MDCFCQIIPNKILLKFSRDRTLTAEQRKHFSNTAAVDAHLRKVRTEVSKLTATTRRLGLVATAVPPSPAITVSDCRNGTVLPGTPVPSPETSADAAARRAAVETQAVADFYREIFGRNSIDNAGMTVASSVHYGTKYHNAFWNGSRMTFGDGDDDLLIDLTRSTDVIAHELTHGVTQFTLQLKHTSQAGALYESLSDVFGSMFRQWRAQQTVHVADWLIGKDIMGPGAKARGFTCLRDMASPGAKHCLTRQLTKFSQFRSGMDPHESSGIPNLAFTKAAMAIGGFSWEKAGQIWYAAMTGFGPSPNMRMKTFANRTRQLAAQMYAGEPLVLHAVDKGWHAVGL